MKIEVIENIEDPDLIIHWKRIQNETDCFPQMYYEWCEPWWRHQSGKRELYIIVVKDINANIVGIAPLCIEKQFSLRILLSFPIHYGDFYSFLVEDGTDEKSIQNLLIKYIKTFQDWHYVKLSQINNKTSLYTTILDAGFFSKKMTGIIISYFGNMTFEDFLKTLPGKVRREYNRRIRRINEQNSVTFDIVDTMDGYKAYLNVMKDIYEERWSDDYSLPPDDAYYQCRMESFGALCNIGKALLCVLKLNDTPIAYRMGFFRGKEFQSWKICFDPKYHKYSPGSMINGYLINELIKRNYTQLNYGCGVYEYKLRWAPNGEASENYSIHASKGTILSDIYLRYQLEWRETLRDYYYKLLDIGLVRTIKRQLEMQQRKLSR